MRILVLGGTRFVGRHIVEAARARGHAVSVFNRGRSALPWDDVEQLTGDRESGDLEALRGRDWDACIDVSGYLPQRRARLGRAARAGASRATSSSRPRRSTTSPAPRRASPRRTRCSPVPEREEDVPGPLLYGTRKVACEQEAERASRAGR